jgi:SAM-dependent methyltransferase
VSKAELLDRLWGNVVVTEAAYAIVNLPRESLPRVFREMARVLQPGGLRLLAFHAGDHVLHEARLWGQTISLDFLFLPPRDIQRLVESAGLAIEQIIECDPYPGVEYQSRRAYILARRPAPQGNT